MNIDRNELKNQSIDFISKYNEFIPDTIYYSDWKNLMGTPNYGTIECVAEILNKLKLINPIIAEIGIGVGGNIVSSCRITK